MKKTLLMLTIMTACLASNAFADAPLDITNPSFEDATGGVCDYWTLWAGGGATLSVYHEGDGANANTGDDYFEVGNGGAGWAGIHTAFMQEVAVTPGTDVAMIMYAKTADGTSQTDSVIMKLEFYCCQGETWDELETLFVEQLCDTTGSYQRFTLYTTVPASMYYARATIVSTGIDVHVDDVWVGEPGPPCFGPCDPGPMDPDPANSSIQSVTNAPAYGYTPVTDLSWNNPDLRFDSTLPSSADLGVEVKFGIGTVDPNFPGASSYSVPAGSGTAFESVALDTDLGVTLPLANDTSYYWQVITADANSSGPVVTEGYVWTFETGDAKPIVQEPVDEYMWLDQEDGDGDSTIRTFTVTTTYTDDGYSVSRHHKWDRWVLFVKR